MRIVLVSLVLIAQTAGPIFRFETDGFWLNLHHYLYVLGRAEMRVADSRREAVAGAPADQAEGLKTLSEADQQAWRDAVSFYAAGPSRKDIVFDAALVQATNQLRRLADDRPAASTTIDPALAAVLDRAAPLYRRAWWTKHREANRAWVATEQALLARYGAQVLAYITGKYQEPWTPGGYPVNVTAFSNWAGAYSTDDALLVLSSMSPNNAGDQGFEIIFHEAMHQWDEAIVARLDRLAKANQTPPIGAGITHAMIFYTAGEAVKAAVPGHQRYADVSGVWNRGMTEQKALLERDWQPYLDGKISLDEALLRLLRK